MKTKVTVYNQQKDLPLSSSSIKNLTSALLSALEISCEEIILHFVSTKKISELHATFFNDPTTTDCISFPLDETILGEVFVCPETAINYSKKHNLDPYTEITLYLIHGILHLLGYDDLTPPEKKKMRRKEKWCLTLLTQKALTLKKEEKNNKEK